jgi:hypothetical protein
MKDSYQPLYIGGDDVFGSATDEYYPTFNRNYLLAMMSSPDAVFHDNVTVFDSSNNILGKFSGGLGVGDEFCPYGISCNTMDNTLITSDFVQHLSAVIGTKTVNLNFGGVVRVWNNFCRGFVGSVLQ